MQVSGPYLVDFEEFLQSPHGIRLCIRVILMETRPAASIAILPFDGTGAIHGQDKKPLAGVTAESRAYPEVPAD